MIVESQINDDRYLIEIGAFEMTYEKDNSTLKAMIKNKLTYVKRGFYRTRNMQS